MAMLQWLSLILEGDLRSLGGAIGLLAIVYSNRKR